MAAPTTPSSSTPSQDAAELEATIARAAAWRAIGALCQELTALTKDARTAIAEQLQNKYRK